MTNCIAINVICFPKVLTAFTKRSETRGVETGQFGVLGQKYHIFRFMVNNCLNFFRAVQHLKGLLQ